MKATRSTSSPRDGESGQPSKPGKSLKDPHHGQGGSYVNGEDGIRRRVELAEGVDRVPRHIPHEPPEEGEATGTKPAAE